ncbi:MAG: lysophospholipid acyltransferase family protein [Planctomycetota bacterium]
MRGLAAADVLAVAVLALLAVAGFAWAAIAIRRFPFRPAQTALYGLNYFLTHVLWGLRVEGRLATAPGQGAVIVCNHRSSIDPCFIAVLVRRPVHWMVAREFCEHWAFRWFLRTCEVIPVSRSGNDTAAMRAAIRKAASGGLVGMFPEGRINTTDALLLPARAGAVRVAIEAGVPIVPCYLEGSPYDGAAVSPLFMPARVRLSIGQPIQLPDCGRRGGDREMLDTLTRRVMRAIAHLAGSEEFAPEIVRRK